MMLRKRKPWTNICLFCVPLEFQPQMKNWAFCDSNGFLNHTKKCPYKQSYFAGSAKCYMKPFSKLLTSVQGWCEIRCAFLKLQKICQNTYNQGHSPHPIILKHLTSLPSAQLFSIQNLDRLRELVKLYFIKKEWPTQIQIHLYLVLGRRYLIFCKKKTIFQL